jgi:hypothetical protein
MRIGLRPTTGGTPVAPQTKTPPMFGRRFLLERAKFLLTGGLIVFLFYSHDCDLGKAFLERRRLEL